MGMYQILTAPNPTIFSSPIKGIQARLLRISVNTLFSLTGKVLSAENELEEV